MEKEQPEKKVNFAELPRFARFGIIFIAILIIYFLIYLIFFHEPLELYERTGARISKYTPIIFNTLIITIAIFFLHKWLFVSKIFEKFEK